MRLQSSELVHFHTVVPIVSNGFVSKQNEKDLQKCYINSLEMAKKMGLKQIAFCCISTGIYGYPKLEAAKLACESVKSWLKANCDAENECKIPTALIPKCPVCGGKMEVNVRKDNTFVKDELWHQENENYQNFLEKAKGKKTLFLEMGVGYNTPTIIKFAFENLVANNDNTSLVRFNRDYPEFSKINKDKTVVFDEDIEKIFDDIRS